MTQSAFQIGELKLVPGFQQLKRGYFGSGKKGFWPRTGYALSSAVLARHDDGRRHLSISQVAGFAAGAALSRAWQPPSTRSAGDAAVSFGISMGMNLLATEVKEFLPDILRPLVKGRKPSRAPAPDTNLNEPAKRY